VLIEVKQVGLFVEYAISISKINPVSRLNFYQFDDTQSMVFDETSSRTHRVNMLCLDALRVLQQGSLSPQALAETLAKRNDFSLDEEWLTYINEMLTDLDQLGLIEPVAS
jgi:PqqD family protein of HPr-rel-A system